MASRQERLVENQGLFRRANERLRERVGTMMKDERRIPFLCECADESCTEPVSVTLDEYASVREDSARYIIVPGHAMIEGEDVLTENERFAVVEKPA